jgi:hypothetical protein
VKTRVMCAEFVQVDWVCVTNIKDLFMTDARNWKINPATCATKICHQDDLFRIGSIFKCEQMFWPLCPMCQWSGKDLYTEFYVLNLRTYLQLIRGSVLLIWHVIRYCCKWVFCSFI